MFFILIGFKYILNRCFVLTGLDTLNIDKNDLDPVSLLMNLPIQKKNMAALVTSTLHLPQAHPKNKIPYTKLDSITENRKKNKKKPKIPEKGWGAHSCWIFVFFCCFFGFFGVCVFLVVLLIVPPVYRGGFTLKMFSPLLPVSPSILSHSLSLGLLCVWKATSQRDAAYF